MEYVYSLAMKKDFQLGKLSSNSGEESDTLSTVYMVGMRSYWPVVQAGSRIAGPGELSLWPRLPSQLNNSAVAAPLWWMKFILSSLRFRIFRSCLGWHASTTLCGHWGQCPWGGRLVEVSRRGIRGCFQSIGHHIILTLGRSMLGYWSGESIC